MLILWFFGTLLFPLKQHVKVPDIKGFELCFSSLWPSVGSLKVFHITSYESTLQSCLCSLLSP